MTEVVKLTQEDDPNIQILFTISGILVIFALVIFFALEMINPQVYVLPDRTIYVMLSIIAALLGLKSLHPYYRDQGKYQSGGFREDE